MEVQLRVLFFLVLDGSEKAVSYI